VRVYAFIEYGGDYIINDELYFCTFIILVTILPLPFFFIIYILIYSLILAYELIREIYDYNL